MRGRPLDRLYRAPWLAGALLLALVAVATATLALRLGPRYWPFYAGLAAGLLLLAGGLERLWQSRPLPRRHRTTPGGSRFRLLRGRRGNGGVDRDDDGETPRWLM